MELGETLKDGAAREAMEEAGADIRPGPILAVYEVPGPSLCPPCLYQLIAHCPSARCETQMTGGVVSSAPKRCAPHVATDTARHRAGIVQICFLAELVNPETLKSGIETLETRLFRLCVGQSDLVHPAGCQADHWVRETQCPCCAVFCRDELPPSDELAFPTVDWALTYARTVLDRAAQDGAGAGG